MLDLKWIRDHPDAFDAGRRRRGLEPMAATVAVLDDRRRAAIAAAQRAQERRNAASRDIGAAMKGGDSGQAEALKAEVAELKLAMPALEAEEKEASAALDALLATLPNQPDDEVPDGADEAGNVLVREWGEKPRFDFAAKEHFTLGEALGLMDFEAATRMSGARFVVNKGPLARLERALGQWMLDLHTGEHGYTEVNPPLLVRDEAMFGTAQLPKFEDDQFVALSSFLPSTQSEEISLLNEQIEKNASVSESVNKVANLVNLYLLQNTKDSQDSVLKSILDFQSKLASISSGRSVNVENAYKGWASAVEALSRKLWLIPTAEVPLTNLVRETVLDESALPLRYTACTPCFRAEAGAAGRDTRGMIRQHQFTKVELVTITTPEQSAAEHARMVQCAETVLQRLALPYRTMLLCTGDMGFASAKTFDIEVWLPGQDRYREISSCSACGDFQARRMNARARMPGAKSPRFVHTLNGSGVAVGRALVAVLENYQEADGAIRVPDVLLPYMAGLTHIRKRG